MVAPGVPPAMSRLATLVSTLVDSLPTASGDLAATETETRTYPAPSALSVSTKNGAVSVRGEDRDDAEVTATKRATDDATLDSVEVVASGGGDEPLHLTAEYDDSLGRAAVDFDVAVPREVPVESVATKNGRIELVDATGDARLESKNGAVEVTDHDGDVEVDAKNGAVNAEGVTGDLTVAATNGRVSVEGLDGFLDAETKNGSIDARDLGGLDRAESKNGSVDVDVDAIVGDAVVTTKSGSVTVRAAPDLDADVTLSTTVGGIDAPAIGESAGGVGGSEVQGRLGDGGPLLFAESTVGSVELVRRE